MTKKIRIALCEDNEDFRESLSMFISETPGYSISSSCSSAADLFSEISEVKPDIILMDIDMPAIDGIKATRMVKALYDDIQVLILTVFEDDEKIFNAILAGANGYILKKIAPPRIIHAIEELVEGGGSMSGSVVKRVLNYFNEKSVKENSYGLSEREKKILECLVNGDSYKMIASNCKITMGTVCSHINNIYKKLHINSKSEAVAKALKENLIF